MEIYYMSWCSMTSVSCTAMMSTILIVEIDQERSPPQKGDCTNLYVILLASLVRMVALYFWGEVVLG